MMLAEKRVDFFRDVPAEENEIHIPVNGSILVPIQALLSGLWWMLGELVGKSFEGYLKD